MFIVGLKKGEMLNVDGDAVVSETGYFTFLNNDEISAIIPHDSVSYIIKKG